MDCRKTQKSIDLYIDGMLDDRICGQIISHIDSCPDCQNKLNETLKLKEALLALNDLEPPVNLAKNAIKKVKSRALFTYVSAASAVAAVAAVIVAVVFSMHSGSDSSPIYESAMLAKDSAYGEKYAAPEEINEDCDALNVAGADGAYMPAPIATGCLESGTGAAARTFSSEAEFAAKFGAGYYRPSVLPDGSTLLSITEGDCFVVFEYSFDGDNTFEFGWAKQDSGQTLRQTEVQSPQNYTEFEQHAQRFWVLITGEDVNKYCAAQYQPAAGG